MTTIKTTPSEIYKEYEKDKAYKTQLKLFETVKRNNKFVSGDQWDGVNAPDLQKPVFNILLQAVKYYISMLVSDDIGISIEDSDDDAQTKSIEDVLKNEVDKVFEQNRFAYKVREFVKNCSVDGDAAIFVRMDDTKAGEVETINENLQKQKVDVLGKIKLELVDNTNVHFADVVEHDVQEQPYIILSFKKYIDDVKSEMEKNGKNADEIKADSDTESYYQEDNDKYVTVLLKLWKENGAVKAIKTTKDVVIKNKWELGIPLYPLAWMSWEKRKGSYHGVASITSEINNQIYVNKLFALCMLFQQMFAFPKLIYDKNKIQGGITNRIGEAIGVIGDPREAIFSAFQMPSMNPQAIELANLTMDKTKDSMGLFKAALGDVRPENTSAIIATQKAASQPLELQKLDLYQAIEDVVRIITEFMHSAYGIRTVKQTIQEIDPMTGQPITKIVNAEFDFSTIGDFKERVKVEIGGSSYWSELNQVQTLDNLYQMGIIPDPKTYVELIPDKYIRDKARLLEALDEKEQQQKLMQEQQAMTQMPMEPPTEENIPMEF